MTAFAPPPEHARPEPAPMGSRWETCAQLVMLTADLLSIPFHLIAFLMTRAAHRRRFRRALDEGSVAFRQGCLETPSS